MDRLEILHKRVLDSPRKNDINLLKYLYYQKYVIKEEDIPDSYYNHQAEIALERGYGHINITESMKKEMASQVIEEQKKSLDYWLEYFLNEDSKMYPTWAKYWAFQGMLKLGSFDKSSHEFSRRTKGTTSPFVELNHEALALSIDTLLKYINKETIEDKELEKLIEKGVFGKIYAYEITLLDKIKKQESNTNDGIWIKYPQGSDHMKLVKSLEGKGTGWCTAGASTAKTQLEGGDFYVYYSYDSEGNPTIPRIAIRMEGNNIGEVRGVAEKQNLESDMESIADKKLQEFSDYSKYQQKVSDMKILTKIYKEYKERELTIKELRFLYEIDKEIVGFGYSKDPRIKEIISERNHNKDYRMILNTLGLKFERDLKLSLLTNGEGIKLPETLNGSLDLSSLTSAEGLVLPETINGNIYLNSLTSAEGLVLPKMVNGSLDLFSLTSAEGLVLPETINGYLDLSNLTSAKGLVLPETINGNIYLNSLTSAKGLVLPKTINDDLVLSGLTNVEGLVLPETINGDLHLNSLTSIENLVLPETINGYLYLDALTSIEGLVLPLNFKCKVILTTFDNIYPENFYKYQKDIVEEEVNRKR